jgi:hypothetical protein
MNGNPVILINVFTVDPGRQQELFEPGMYEIVKTFSPATTS